MTSPAQTTRPRPGRFGAFGGQFVPPVLLPALDRLVLAFDEAWGDAGFRAAFDDLLHRFVGRPTPLLAATGRDGADGGARLLLKRDDLISGGAYANAALGQCLLAKRMGFRAVVTDTGSGQNGVATAAIAARLGLACRVFMGARDARQQRAAAKKIHAFGADLTVVEETGGSLHGATSAAFRHWMGHTGTTAYVAGAPIGPHPYPTMVGAFQATIGQETRRQMLEMVGLPAAVVSTVGGGASALGLFSAFVDDLPVRLVAVEAAGSGRPGALHSARLALGRRGVLHGAETLVLTDDNGQILQAASIAPGLAYPGSAPQLAHLAVSGRLESIAVPDDDARDAVRRCAVRDGVLVSLEAGHALAAAERIARELPASASVVAMVPSSGDKDLDIIWPDT
jgi:tryptophan synthase beta chain